MPPIVIPVVVGSNPIAHPTLSMTYAFFLMKNIGYRYTGGTFKSAQSVPDDLLKIPLNRAR